MKVDKKKLEEFIRNQANKALLEFSPSSSSSDLIASLDSLAITEEEKLYVQNFKEWLSHNAPNVKVELINMNLPKNVAGFTTQDSVYINKSNIESRGSHQKINISFLIDTIFSTIHEIGHYKEFESKSEELFNALSSEDYDVFIRDVIAVEKRVDAYAEAEMNKINSASNLPLGYGVNKQPFDLTYYMAQYTQFMKQLHKLFLQHKDKHKTFSDFQKAIAFGDLKIFEGETAPAPAKPIVTPSTPPKERPLKIPKKWPGPMPKPMPKAKHIMNLAEQLTKLFKSAKETDRNRRLIGEAMDINRTPHGEPHPSIKSGVETGEGTPFRDIELFKTRVLDKSALEKLGSEEFNAIINSIDHSELVRSEKELYNLFTLAVITEKAHRSQLEHLALNIVQKKFGLPNEIMERIKASLTEQQISPPEGDGSPEQEVEDQFTSEQQAIIKKHLDKRIIHNALMMGAGYRAHSVFNEIKSSLDAIDTKLYPLYKKFMGNVEIFMWKTPLETETPRVCAGKSELDIQPNGDIQAKAVANLFPILLHEVAKAAMELLFAQHLVDVYEKHGEKVYGAVMKKSESYYQEHWMKLIGPRLWKHLHDAIDYVVHENNEDYTIVSYVLNRMATMEPEEFLSLIHDILHNGQTAIQKIKAIVSQVQNDINDFENQNNTTPQPQDIETGEDHSGAIADLVRQDSPANLQSPQSTQRAPIRQLSDMNIDELNNELGKALEDEQYERATAIRDEINSR